MTYVSNIFSSSLNSNRKLKYFSVEVITFDGESYSVEVEARNADEAQEPLARRPNGRQIAAVQGWFLAYAKRSAITQAGKLILPGWLSAGAAFSFAHLSLHPTLLFVYRLSGTASMPTLAVIPSISAVFRAGASQPSELTAQRSCRSVLLKMIAAFLAIVP